MFRLMKGEAGYRKRLKTQYISFTVLLLLCIGFQMYVKQYFSERLQMIITVSMLITALPAALMVARLFTISKFKPLEKEIYEEYRACEENFPMLYELLITSTDRVLPMAVIAVHPTGGIYAYCTDSRIKVQKAEDEMNETLRDQNLNFKVRISTDKRTFDKRIKSLKPASEYEPNEKMDEVISVLKAMSM